jgi:ornithine lipid ester-linked acyl 2-hydroxylase
MQSKLWFSIYDRGNYPGTESAFIEQESFDWTKKIQQHYIEIKKELEDYLKTSDLKSYFNSTMVEKQNSWKTISLKWWNLQLYKNQKHFPLTTKLLNEIPGCVSASFNLLEANSAIKPHAGDTNGIYRCHFGISIPATPPRCGFKVKSETREWKDGNWLIFLDAFEHEAWNHSEENRYIMVVDLIRTEFSTRKNKICSTVLTGLFMQKIAERFKIMYRISPRGRRLIAKTLRPFCLPAMHLRNVASRAGIVD